MDTNGFSAAPVSAPKKADPDRLELALRRQLKGTTLLAEIPFDEQQCRATAQCFSKIILRDGKDPGREEIRRNWPIMFCALAHERGVFQLCGSKVLAVRA